MNNLLEQKEKHCQGARTEEKEKEKEKLTCLLTIRTRSLSETILVNKEKNHLNVQPCNEFANHKEFGSLAHKPLYQTEKELALAKMQ